MLVRERLLEVALERSLRHSTVLSYERLLGRIGALDLEVALVSREWALTAVWTLDGPNTRRAVLVALRAVCGLSLPIPRSVPRRYDLPSEDTLRLALMQTPHETRCLLMAYGGLRVGEACAITARDISGDRLTVDKQVSELTQTGKDTIVRIGPVKSREDVVYLPHWLAPRVEGLEDWVKPSTVRESLRRAGRKVGLSLNPHQLRHWSATTLLERGVPLPVVSKHLRHSSIETTLAYAQTDQAGSIHSAFG